MREVEVKGLAADTLQGLEGIEHLRASIVDILRTPIGTRVMRRGYGSRLFDLLDMPLNDETKFEIYASVAEALERWEPRIALRRVRVESVKAGKMTLDIDAVRIADGTAITLRELLVS